MKKILNKKIKIHAIVFFIAMISASCASLALAGEISKSSRMGGLYENEIISMEVLRQKQVKDEKFLLIDARNKQSYDEGHIPGAVLSLTEEYYHQSELFRMGIIQSLPDNDAALAEAMSKYPKNTPIVTYCNDHCQASAVLLLKIKRLGFQNVQVMEGGFQQWQAKGYPVIKSDPKS